MKYLIEEAIKAAQKAYAPYSGYYVGAALQTKDGRIFRGCNVENASYGATNCAERTAIFKAVSEGAREFSAIAIVGGPEERISGESTGLVNGERFSEYAYPCGICRQVLQEFCGQDFRIIVARSVDDYKVYSLKELLPHGFGPC